MNCGNKNIITFSVVWKNLESKFFDVLIKVGSQKLMVFRKFHAAGYSKHVLVILCQPKKKFLLNKPLIMVALFPSYGTINMNYLIWQARGQEYFRKGYA